jgi:hypothetical protein
MNKRCQVWTDKIISEMKEPFTALTIREKLVERHKPNYIESNTSIGQYLAKNCVLIGVMDSRNVYRKCD